MCAIGVYAIPAQRFQPKNINDPPDCDAGTTVVVKQQTQQQTPMYIIEQSEELNNTNVFLNTRLTRIALL